MKRKWSTMRHAASVLFWMSAVAQGITLNSNRYYRLESRDDGWVARKSGTALILSDCPHDPEMRFKFTAVSNGFYTVSTESGSEVLTVSSGSLTVGAAVNFSPGTGADCQLWQVVDLGDGYCKLVAKHSGRVLGHTIDTTVTNPVDNDGTGAQLRDDGADNTEWLIAESQPLPYNNLGVNQNGWASAQKKVVVYTSTSNISAPSYSVTGPQTKSGTMTSWGTKWGLYFYTADVTSLTNEGRYAVSANGLSQGFNIYANPFADVRGINGGELTWSNVVSGFLACQSAPSVTGFDTMNKATGDENVGWTEIAGTHQMTNGLYDATSRDSKVARTATSAKFIALAMLETPDPAKKNALLTVARMLVDNLSGDQNPDGSFPLGKFRTSSNPPEYHWSVDTDSGITARSTEALALLSQALKSADTNRSARALKSATNGWNFISANPTNFLIDLPAYSGLLADYYGSQASVIAAAIELYLATSNSTYSTFADSRINEANYNNGIYHKSTGSWPGTYDNDMDDLQDAHTIIALCRYYPAVGSSIKTKLDTQISGWTSHWTGQVDTPWGVPENGGAPAVVAGWGRNLASLAPQLLKVAALTSSTNTRNAGTAIIDYLLGNNAVGSSFYVGAGQRNLHPRFKYSSEKTKGDVIPGIKTEGGTLSLTNQAWRTGESVTMHSVSMLMALALAEKSFTSTTNTKPMFCGDPVAEADAFTDTAYIGTLTDHVFDPDGDPLTYSKISGPAWLNVASNGVLSGTPAATNRGLNTFTVRVSDASGYDQVALQLNVQSVVLLPQVVVVQRAGATYNNTNPGTTVTVGTFTAQTNDILVLAAAGSNGNHLNPAAVTWVSTNGGAVNAGTLFSKSAAGIWYTSVTTGGTFNVNFTLTNNFTTVGAYLLYATAGGTLQVNTQTVFLASAATSTNAALTYSFGTSGEGVIIECIGTGAGGGATPNYVTMDYTSGIPPKRNVGSGSFTSLTALNTSWTVVQTGTAANVSLAGIAIYKDSGAPVTSYTLTVNGGSGSGSYTNGQQVVIASGNAPSGKTFDVWTGSTQYLAGAVSAATNTVIMPANAVTLTATYKDIVYSLTGNAGANGTVTPSSTNVVYGSNAVFVVTANNYYRIATLTTNGTAVGSFNNSSTATNFIWSNVLADGTLAATFTNQVANDPAGTPYEWLAQYGLTNYDADAVADQDLDGLKAWQEYVAGTVPTNAASVFRASQSSPDVISWITVSGRVYSVFWTTNLMSGFTGLNTNILYPQNRYTNADPGDQENFYRLKVRMQ